MASQNFSAVVPSASRFPDGAPLCALSLTRAPLPDAVHISGSKQAYSGSELHNSDWYTATFLPKMENYKKGPLVWSSGKIKTAAEQESRLNAIVDGKIYDLTDYFYTVGRRALRAHWWEHTTDPRDPLQINLLNDDTYKFLDEDLSALWQAQPGTDITSSVKDLNMDPTTHNTNMDCIKTLFAQGETDFRLTPRCQVQPNMLLAFSVLLMVTILAKFLAALQFGSKRMPELRDKFVICELTARWRRFGSALTPSPAQAKCRATPKGKSRYARPSTHWQRSRTTISASYS